MVRYSDDGVEAKVTSCANRRAVERRETGVQRGRWQGGKGKIVGVGMGNGGPVPTTLRYDSPGVANPSLHNREEDNPAVI